MRTKMRRNQMKLNPALLGGLALAGALLGIGYGTIGSCIWLIKAVYGA